MKKSAFTREYKTMLQLLSESRKKSGITQVGLAKKLGMTQSAYSKLERGELRLDLIQVRQICTAIGSSLPSFVAELESRLTKKKRPRK
jgi:transcriptional regulator with XRE-family HTH domain